ncbi:hypothetical protein [Pedobacter sp. L105]|uniref:hypothetical protein n=1 Tax=Pedobacter sp. L105 TaxID=1641871 RepID=UPI00131EA093|nr:hypothetical protein [Pedobacter sp. L105]
MLILITIANYKERNTTFTNAFNYNIDSYSETHYTYDQNRNTLTLKRNSSTPGMNTLVEVDNLTYSYDAANPNQLLTVNDGTTTDYTSYGFRNLTANTGGTYTYDPNGNLKTDPYKGIKTTGSPIVFR